MGGNLRRFLAPVMILTALVPTPTPQAFAQCPDPSDDLFSCLGRIQYRQPIGPDLWKLVEAQAVVLATRENSLLVVVPEHWVKQTHEGRNRGSARIYLPCLGRWHQFDARAGLKGGSDTCDAAFIITELHGELDQCTGIFDQLPSAEGRHVIVGRTLSFSYLLQRPGDVPEWSWREVNIIRRTDHTVDVSERFPETSSGAPLVACSGDSLFVVGFVLGNGATGRGKAVRADCLLKLIQKIRTVREFFENRE